MTEPQRFWARLQTTFARGAPVIAIGPGCHRIGYESSEGWERVVERVGQVWRRLEQTGDEETVLARRDFLERFWQAQLCDDGFAGDGERATIAGHDRDEDSPDALRIALATYLLCGLIEATRLLGATLETGSKPAMDWQHLVADVEPGEEGSRPELLAQARAWLRRAMDLAAGVGVAHDGTADSPLPPALEECDLSRPDVDGEKLTLLKVREIESALRVLLENRLEEGADSVAGAVVEWLSDLFWHVLVSGAKVPPSQSELGFYLNLHEFEYSSRRFSRSHPGEYRGPEEDDGTIFRDNLRELVEDYDSGLEDRARDWTRPREAFAWTMARSLIKSWYEEEQERFAIAIVSDYDLMLERAMLEQLQAWEQFHIVVPATVNWDGQYKYKWLMGTLEAGAGKLAEPRWEWLARREKSLGESPGPIIIRLTGTPLFSLSQGAEDRLLETKGLDNVTEVWPTAVFSEHDSVQAIMALMPSQHGTQSEKRFREQLLLEKEGLTWSWRGWLFFGHRFSDWLPRLQLLITALILGQDKHVEPGKLKRELKLGPFEAAPKLAVSRRFDWPERALLDTLGIKREERDLADVTRYYERRGEERLDERTETFMREMSDASCGSPPEPISPPPSETTSPPCGNGGDLAKPRRVFISYSQEGEDRKGPWMTTVRQFARALSKYGVKVTLDQLGPYWGRDWLQWGPTELAKCERVICLASPRYREEWDRATEGRHRAAATEARTIRVLEQEGKIGVMFAVLPGRSSDDVPDSFKGIHREVVESIDFEGLEEVARQVTDQPAYEELKPAPPMKLPPKE